jgi:acyl-CoA synthetase (AMP-forming)/AMP-acid ligase II
MEFQLADLYECLCDAGPDADVVIGGGRRLSRADLDARANRLAHHLQAEGVGAGDHVGIYATNRLEWIEALLACWKIRAAAVNVNYRYVTDELRYIWDNSDIVALVYEREFSPHVATLAGEFPALRSTLVLEDGSDAAPGPGGGYEAALAAASEARDFGPRSGDDIYLVYTGGTTGMPKGVLWRHEDLYRNVIAALMGEFDAPEQIAKQAGNPLGMRTLTLSPLMHGGGQFPFLITVMNGGVGLFPVSKSFDPREVLSIIEKERVTTLSIIGDAMGRPIAGAPHRGGEARVRLRHQLAAGNLHGGRAPYRPGARVTAPGLRDDHPHRRHRQLGDRKRGPRDPRLRCRYRTPLPSRSQRGRSRRRPRTRGSRLRPNRATGSQRTHPRDWLAADTSPSATTRTTRRRPRPS